MKLVFVVERPTQFEAPFYRFAARDPEHRLRVIFTGAAPGAPALDPELGRPIDWGFDLLSGYDWAALPATGRGRFLARELAPRSADLVIVNGYTRRAYLQAAWRARRSGLPTALRLDSVVVSGGGLPGALRSLARRGIYRGPLRMLFDLFLGVGTGTLEFLAAQGIAASRRALFPYAIDVLAFRERSRLSADERAAMRARLGLPAAAHAVLSLAKFGPREAPWDLLRAFPALAAADPDAHLVLAGDGPERPALEALASDLGVAARVRFPGYVPYPDLPALYAAADLFVHPAAEERWGVSVEEALACGLPAIAANQVGAGRDLIAPGENGYRYRPGRPAELAERLAAGLALDRERVRTASARILAAWDYAATWKSLLEAAGRVRRRP